MAVKENSFENRDKRNKKKSSIVKMSELREENKLQEEVKAEETTIAATINIEDKKESPNAAAIKETIKTSGTTDDEVTTLFINEKADENNSTAQKIEMKNKLQIENDFFNLNVKNDTFGGKLTTVRVFDDILETLKSYAAMKNYQIIEFTNKVITLGLEDLDQYGITEITEIKLKNNTSRAIMYNLTDSMEDTINKYIKAMSKKGYKISRNVILNVLLNETLKKFYI